MATLRRIRTRIGKRLVPVLGAHRRTVVTFTAGAHGKRERGRYHFWTAVGEDVYGPWVIICRNRIRLPWGERFNRMEREAVKSKGRATRRAYARAWRMAQQAMYLRPSSMRELASWAYSHRDDWQHVRLIEYRGATYRKIPRSLT